MMRDQLLNLRTKAPVSRSTADLVSIPDVPAIPGLAFRCLRGKEDYPAMTTVIAMSREADGLERVTSVEDLARLYRHAINFDPKYDVLVAEVGQDMAGYSQVWWDREVAGDWLYLHFVRLLPHWRRTGLRRAMLRYNEHRLRQIAARHLGEGERFFQAWASDSETHWVTLLIDEGYRAVRYHFDMVRPNLEDIPDLPMPEGLEVRPVEPHQVDTIRAAACEAFLDEWGATESEEAWQREWQESPTYMPHLWQVAWDGDEVAGIVHNFVDEAENEEYGRRRGYTEGIGVRRPWRRRGLAKALIARSFWVLRAHGLTEAALGVDAENPSGALRLYETMGFQVVKRETTFRKPMDRA